MRRTRSEPNTSNLSVNGRTENRVAFHLFLLQLFPFLFQKSLFAFVIIKYFVETVVDCAQIIHAELLTFRSQVSDRSALRKVFDILQNSILVLLSLFSNGTMSDARELLKGHHHQLLESGNGSEFGVLRSRVRGFI